MSRGPLDSDRPIIAYLDFKSPYAYLAVEPTRELARELDIEVDWRPFVLDIPSYLGSAKLDRKGRVAEQSRTDEQWSGVKYAYFDCRRYANLRGLTVRGTVKIWDTNPVAIGMLWAKRQGDEVLARYIDGIYEPFWKRELDAEDLSLVAGVLRAVGAETDGFEGWAAGPGAEENDALQRAAFDAGIFGVPTFVVDGERYFGREHLPRIRWQLTGAQGPAPDIGNPLPAKLDVAPAKALEACIDFKSPQSYVALGPTLALGVPVRWRHLRTPPLKRPADHGDGTDRGTRHRRWRSESVARDLERYAPHALSDLYPDFDSGPAALGLLWLERERPQSVERYVRDVFQRFWRDGLVIDRVDAVREVLGELGDGFEEWVAREGELALEASERELGGRGVHSTPGYLIEDEPYLGRQHLPLIRARLQRD